MIWFVLGAAALVAATLAIVLRPLLRDPPARGGTESAAVNTAVLKDQLDELERDRATGVIADGDYEQAKLELKRRLLEDTHATDGASPAARRRPWAAITVAAAVPLVAAGLYLVLGSPAALDPARREAQIGPAEIEAMVERLARRLDDRPDDPEGWVMLGRSYNVLRRYAAAAAAYQRAESIVLGDARLLAEYAESLALAHEGNLQGKPAQLVARALELDPEYPPALLLAGAVAFQRAEYQGAVRYWERARAKLEPESELARSLDDNIARARELAAGAKPAAKPPAVAGTVRLAAGFASKAASTDTVFVFARAAGGPPMPLAVLRKQVKDLPLAFTLDDSLAMAPDLRLSGFAEVVVVARVSRSGSATPQSGDLQGLSPPVKVGATGVAVVIDTAVP